MVFLTPFQFGVFFGLKIQFEKPGILVMKAMRPTNDRLECLFVKRRIIDVERRRRFLAHFKLEIKKLCVVHTYVDMDELLVAAIKVEKVVGKIGETPFEPLKDEKDEKVNERDSST